MSTTFGNCDSKKGVEELLIFAPKFDKAGLIPALAMDAEPHEPLMLAYMNEESLKMTLKLGEAVYYSRQEIWHKGDTSDHTQKVKSIKTDCDQDAIIVYINQHGSGACHTGRNFCFYREIALDSDDSPTALRFTEDLTFNPEDVYKK